MIRDHKTLAFATVESNILHNVCTAELTQKVVTRAWELFPQAVSDFSVTGDLFAFRLIFFFPLSVKPQDGKEPHFRYSYGAVFPASHICYLLNGLLRVVGLYMSNDCTVLKPSNLYEVS